MSWLPVFLLLITFINVFKAEHLNRTSLRCNDFYANFNLKKILGTWHVVAIVPSENVPKEKGHITCFRVDFSESEEAGLRWLINNTYGEMHKEKRSQIKRTVIRQRYHSAPPFDIWSKSVDGVNGCFHQVISLDSKENNTILEPTITKESLMQLHILENDDGSGPFLLQMLWGKLISLVVYKKKQGIGLEELKPVMELMTKLRGPQAKPQLCDIALRDLLV